MSYRLEENEAGRLVPTVVNGRDSTPFQGVGAYQPSGRKAAPRIVSCAAYPKDGDKRAASLREALEQVGLSDGTFVEVVSGLLEGDQVVVEYQEATEQQFGNFRGGMPGMPGGAVRIRVP